MINQQYLGSPVNSGGIRNAGLGKTLTDSKKLSTLDLLAQSQNISLRGVIG